MATKLSDLTAATNVAAGDLIHIRTMGGIDKKITKSDFITSIISSPELAFSFKGMSTIQLTEYDTTTVPEIAANCACEIDGTIYNNTSAITISGSTSNSTWYDILLTPSGTSYLASFVARETGVWSDSKQGLYSGNNRVIACVYRDGSGNFINKNVLTVRNRIVEIKMEIGTWDMYVSGSGISYKQVYHGLSSGFINAEYTVYVHRDDLARAYILAQPHDHYIMNSYIYLGYDGSTFNTTDFNSTGINRGYVILRYKV